MNPGATCGALLVAVAALALTACAGTPHALEYVVLQNGHDQQRPPPPEVVKHEAEANGERKWPIYDDPVRPPEGTGGAGCSVGLIGSVCERGLLDDVEPLEERSLLGEDGKVRADPIDVYRPPLFEEEE